MPHWKCLFCYFSWSWKVLFASEQSQRNKVSGVWLWLWWNQSLTVLNIWGREGLRPPWEGSEQWNEHLISMVHSGVHKGFSVGQTQFCLKCQQSQFWLFQLGIKWWLSVHPSLFRWCCCQAACALFFPTAAAAVTFSAYTTVHSCGRHSQKIKETWLFPQIHTPEGIFGSRTVRKNSQVDLHLTKPYSQRQEERRPSFRVQSWGIAPCPCSEQGQSAPLSSFLSWENKQSTGQCYSGGLHESCGLQQSWWNILGDWGEKAQMNL